MRRSPISRGRKSWLDTKWRRNARALDQSAFQDGFPWTGVEPLKSGLHENHHAAGDFIDGVRNCGERDRTIACDWLIVVSNDAHVLGNAKSSPQNLGHERQRHVIVDYTEAGRSLIQAEESPRHFRAA